MMHDNVHIRKLQMVEDMDGTWGSLVVKALRY
jgi:hypothetical protein